LRQRAEDIPLLADHLLRKHRNAGGATAITAEALQLLLRNDWPGNIRELENELERASVLAGAQNPIQPEHLSTRLRRTGVPPSGPAAAPPATAEPTGSADGGTDNGGESQTMPLREARARFEAEHIRRALLQHNRNVSHTARALGLSRVMLQKKMKEYGLRDA
jgi:two-component system response regulator HupR/HoxA